MNLPRSRSLRVIAALTTLIALAAVASGCASKGGSTATSGSGAGGPNSVAGGAADQPSQGVTADSVSVGYLIVDIGELSKNLGFVVVDDGGYENVKKGVQAVVDYVNAHGGAGGRKINPVFRPYTGQNDSPEFAEAQCRAFTQDSQVFAVVMDGQFQNNARPCYQAARTIMLDQTPVPLDKEAYDQFSPYLWSTSLPRYDLFTKSLLTTLQSTGFFTGATGVAVVAPDSEVGRRISSQLAVPYLQSIGVTKTSQFFIDVSNVGTLGATTSAALTGAKTQGINRVITLGGERIEAVMLADVSAEELNARYSITSYDNPPFFVDNPDTIVTKSRVGMVGLGIAPSLDARLNSSPEVFPNPQRPNEGLCKQIVDGAGAAPPTTNRENYRVVFQFCDATLMLKAALDKAPKQLTPNAFRDAMWSLGTSYSSALNYGINWSPGVYAPVNVVRGIYWDDTCSLTGRTSKGCFRFGTADLPLATG